MVRTIKTVVLAGMLMAFAAPAFAQVPPALNPLGIDLDPFHIFTPAPAPVTTMAPEPKTMMMHKKMMKTKMMKKKMMKKKMMMKKPMMKKPMKK